MKWASQKGDMNLSHYNGKLISETTHVTKLFKTYFTKIAERPQYNFIPGTLKCSNVNQKVCASIFFTTNRDEITTIIRDLKNKKSSGLIRVSSFLINVTYI
jgi:hypothetical protein